MNENKPIRILCVFSCLDRGGAESMCMNLYRHIDRERIQFDFVKHTDKRGHFEEEIRNLGGKIYEAPRYNGYNHMTYVRWWKKHFESHPEHQIVHGHYFTISALYFKVAKKCGRTTIGHIHSSASDSIIKSFLVHKISKYSDYNLACSQEAGNWIYGKKKFTVMKNAIDAEAFRVNHENREQYRQKFGFDHNITVLGTVANFSAVKNPKGLLDIFVAIHKINPNTRLLWVGEGQCRAEIEKRIKEEQLESKVKLLGARKDVAYVLQAMDAFLLPSFHEGLPVSVIEAQAAGLKCFISDCVTDEADITERCDFLPLHQENVWAEKILNTDLAKIDTSQMIKTAGYDITTTSKWLEEFYVKMSVKNEKRKK